MDRLAYCGHPFQLYGVEEQRLCGGRAEGMRVLEVKNGLGLNFTVLLDRGCGIARLSYRGINCSFMSASGLRRPEYYEHGGGDQSFLRSFHAGFLTTCGLFNVGVACSDGGEQTCLHGDLDNIPVESWHWWTGEDGNLHIEALIRVEQIFYHKAVLRRHFTVGLERSFLTIEDRVTNTGSTVCPVMILYHMNMGYPLLDEDTRLFINSTSYQPRTEIAASDAARWNVITAPEHNYQERCYYHSFRGTTAAGHEGRSAIAAVYQPKHDLGLAVSFDPENLPFFTQWKQCGYRDYALGLEPGNSHCDGRNLMRRQGMLREMGPGEQADFHVQVDFFSGEDSFNSIREQWATTADGVPALNSKLPDWL
ncbi:DUF4432 family protein [Anaerobiospirillum sp. NML120449]|uniref:DUF4432 family protein n=1 Tax=Anaerobiospirillum sp. NML120449 TaxID=2932817 RepID=UPI001FF6810F|nr:DUF4432 family protein [Anaerobiospirillum sp. NML120449]MCK0527421.1 aldose 1-epimerase family protein [Anaerobiospirillum sp. NML120449]